MRSAFAVIVDFVSLVGLVCLAASGAVLRWQLPPGTEGLGYKFGKAFQVKLEGKTLLGLDRAQWSEIHFWLAVGFAAVILVHFLIGWSSARRG